MKLNKDNKYQITLGDKLMIGNEPFTVTSITTYRNGLAFTIQDTNGRKIYGEPSSHLYGCEIIKSESGNTITHEHVNELLDDAVNNVFLQLQNENGITDGGIYFSIAWQLEERQKALADMILECVNWQYAVKHWND